MIRLIVFPGTIRTTSTLSWTHLSGTFECQCESIRLGGSIPVYAHWSCDDLFLNNSRTVLWPHSPDVHRLSGNVQEELQHPRTSSSPHEWMDYSQFSSYKQCSTKCDFGSGVETLRLYLRDVIADFSHKSKLLGATRMMLKFDIALVHGDLPLNKLQQLHQWAASR